MYIHTICIPCIYIYIYQWNNSYHDLSSSSSSSTGFTVGCEAVQAIESSSYLLRRFWECLTTF